MNTMLKGRTAVVTGARRGIGAAIARVLLDQGVQVVMCGRDAPDLAAKAEALGPDAIPFAGDLSDPAARARLREVAGPADILVNNAGGFLRASTTADCSAREWAEQIDLNLTVPFELCRAFLPGMLERGRGRIVNIGSLVAEAPQLGNSIGYVAAKAGLVGFTRQLAAEVAGSGVTVNVINPGTIHTEHLSDYFATMQATSPQAGPAESLARWIPVGRLGHAEEVAALVPYLVSDSGAFTTGSVFNVNGGAIHA
jgi:NAD(P)-dependent dehydrogenase (short-subunit alcohol dehydrogenase family)